MKQFKLFSLVFVAALLTGCGITHENTNRNITHTNNQNSNDSVCMGGFNPNGTCKGAYGTGPNGAAAVATANQVQGQVLMNQDNNQTRVTMNESNNRAEVQKTKMELEAVRILATQTLQLNLEEMPDLDVNGNSSFSDNTLDCYVTNSCGGNTP